MHLLPLDGSAEPAPFVEHENLIVKAAFSPDGEQVATVSTDATVRFWDRALGTELFALRLPALSGLYKEVWDFDFRCAKTSVTGGDCWVAVPLTRGKLAVYHPGQLDK